jgi:hypothetical protein
MRPWRPSFPGQKARLFELLGKHGLVLGRVDQLSIPENPKKSRIRQRHWS